MLSSRFSFQQPCSRLQRSNSFLQREHSAVIFYLINPFATIRPSFLSSETFSTIVFEAQYRRKRNLISSKFPGTFLILISALLIARFGLDLFYSIFSQNNIDSEYNWLIYKGISRLSIWWTKLRFQLCLSMRETIRSLLFTIPENYLKYALSLRIYVILGIEIRWRCKNS